MSPKRPYAVEWAAPARRSMARLPEKAATAAIEFIYGPLADTPHRVGRALRWELERLYSARRGDYQIVYRIDDDQRVVVIAAIGHRADIYRRREL